MRTTVSAMGILYWPINCDMTVSEGCIGYELEVGFRINLLL